jgi:hypothetical protein
MRPVPLETGARSTTRTSEASAREGFALVRPLIASILHECAPGD